MHEGVPEEPKKETLPGEDMEAEIVRLEQYLTETSDPDEIRETKDLIGMYKTQVEGMRSSGVGEGEEGHPEMPTDKEYPDLPKAA